MARRVIWAPRARYDIRLAREYIARDSPEAARKFVRAVIQIGRSLAELSERGRIVPELDEPGVREVFVYRYRVIFEVYEDRVAMLRVIHGGRDLLAAWGRASDEQ